MANWQNILLQILPYLFLGIPILLVINWFLKQNVKMKQLELSMAKHKELLPLKMQAYERLTIFLERINPENLVLREQKQGLSSVQLHHSMLKNIRAEFEHNLAMQIYVPIATWDLITHARDEVIKTINTCSGEVNPSSPSMMLSQKILENSINDVVYHIKKAKDTLKKDIEEYYY